MIDAQDGTAAFPSGDVNVLTCTTPDKCDFSQAANAVNNVHGWRGHLTMLKSDEVALRFTRRAEELRTIAPNVKDPECREAMLKWAADYDLLAERAVQLHAFGSIPRSFGDAAR